MPSAIHCFCKAIGRAQKPLAVAKGEIDLITHRHVVPQIDVRVCILREKIEWILRSIAARQVERRRPVIQAVRIGIAGKHAPPVGVTSLHLYLQSVVVALTGRKKRLNLAELT